MSVTFMCEKFQKLSLYSLEVIYTKKKSATSEKKKMSEASRSYLESGPLKYEVEFYEFARQVFSRKLRDLGIRATDA